MGLIQLLVLESGYYGVWVEGLLAWGLSSVEVVGKDLELRQLSLRSGDCFEVTSMISSLLHLQHRVVSSFGSGRTPPLGASLSFIEGPEQGNL